MSLVLLFAVCVASMTAYWPLREFNMETGGFFMDDVACHSLLHGDGEGFQPGKWGYPNRWMVFVMENPMNMDDDCS